MQSRLSLLIQLQRCRVFLQHSNGAWLFLSKADLYLLRQKSLCQQSIQKTNRFWHLIQPKKSVARSSNTENSNLKSPQNCGEKHKNCSDTSGWGIGSVRLQSLPSTPPAPGHDAVQRVVKHLEEQDQPRVREEVEALPPHGVQGPGQRRRPGRQSRLQNAKAGAGHCGCFFAGFKPLRSLSRGLSLALKGFMWAFHSRVLLQLCPYLMGCSFIHSPIFNILF